MNSTKKIGISVIILLWMTLGAGGIKEKQKPFSVIRWAAGPLTNVGQSDLNQYWRYSGGFSLNARTPFYFGFAELGMAFHSYDEYESVEFSQIHCYLAFLNQQSLSRMIKTHLGITIGNSFFRFDSEENKNLKNESELTLGIRLGTDIAISERLAAQITAHYLNVFTSHVIKTANVGILVAYQMKTPRWIVEFLK